MSNHILAATFRDELIKISEEKRKGFRVSAGLAATLGAAAGPWASHSLSGGRWPGVAFEWALANLAGGATGWGTAAAVNKLLDRQANKAKK